MASIPLLPAVQNKIPDIAINEEFFEVVDSEGRVTGLATRSEAHSNPSLIHRVVHVLVFNKQGDLLLQKRSLNKDIAPGRWDTSVGGHVNPGENVLDAAVREMREELGIEVSELQFRYNYLFRNHRESELVSTFACICEDEIHFNAEEIDEVKFWSMDNINEQLGTGIFSSHFEQEFTHYLQQV